MTRLFAIALLLAIATFAGDTVRPGLEPLETSYYIDNETEEKLVEALKQPLLEGLDVEAALQDWFDGRLLHTQNKKKEAEELWQKALGKLKDLKPLPIPEWGPIPEAKFTMLQRFRLPEYPDVLLVVVQWEVDKLKQYGILMVPVNTPKGAQYPLILYCHGAAAGIPLSYFYGWLADLAMQGYVVIGPAMRGEPLFQSPIKINGEILSCEGEIENLDGEVNDCLSMINAAWKLPFVRKNEFAMVGHSFGAGAGLLAAARANEHAKAVVSYDAWLVNPQRYYWDRMARGANNWLSWADFCNQPVKNQLQGLMTRSIVHNAHKLKCPLLFFIGGAYEGSVFRKSHDDLHKNLKKHNIPYTYEIIEGGGHNFVLYTEYEESKKAFKIQTEFLKKHYPPYKPKAER